MSRTGTSATDGLDSVKELLKRVSSSEKDSGGGWDNGGQKKREVLVSWQLLLHLYTRLALLLGMSRTEGALNPLTWKHRAIYKLSAFLNTWQIATPPLPPHSCPCSADIWSTRKACTKNHAQPHIHISRRRGSQFAHLDNWAACWEGSRGMDPLLLLSVGILWSCVGIATQLQWS